MSTFFTKPASQRKRKRSDAGSVSAPKRRPPAKGSGSRPAPRRRQRDESISGSGSSADEQDDFFTAAEDESASSEDEKETAAEKRLRLAEQYLENIRNEVAEEVGFDAADIDRDLIAERLKEDTAEQKGRVYRNLADRLDLEGASLAFARSKQYAVTGCAAHLPYVWTISKDMVVAKWEIPEPGIYNAGRETRPTNITPRKTPKRLLWKIGNRHMAKDAQFLGHTGAILSIAVSDSGTHLATGDEKARVVIWNAETLTPLKVFTQHRAAVLSLSFRRGTHQLFSGSADRTVKVWDTAQLAYIETLFGHQDTVVDIAGGLEVNRETCVSVGSRDRTARLWQVVEENQLVFRGGGHTTQKVLDKLRRERFGDTTTNAPIEDLPVHAEGSIDCVALLDAGLFVTGSDNGSLCLWSMHKKKPLCTMPLAHGLNPPLPADQLSADADAAEKGIVGPRLPRWITALATIPFADLILSGSWDGLVKAWKVSTDKRSLLSMGVVGQTSGGSDTKHPQEGSAPVKGIINGLSVCERGPRGKDGMCVVAAVGKEPRLGRWMKQKGSANGVAVFELSEKVVSEALDRKDGEPEEDDVEE